MLVAALLLGAAAVTNHCARLGAHLAWHQREHLLGIGTTLLGACACVSLIHGAPGQGLHWSPGTLLVAGAVLAILLRLLHRPTRSGIGWRIRRALCAMAGAGLLTLLGWRQTDVPYTLDPILLPMVLLVAMGALLASSLRQLGRQRTEDHAADSRLALEDALTGLPNRKALEASLAKAAQRCDGDRTLSRTWRSRHVDRAR